MPGMSFGLQVAVLFVLAIPIACVAWTVTHEEIFREPRDGACRGARPAAASCSASSSTCSPANTASATTSRSAFLIMTRFRLWLDDWRGYVLAGFSLVFIANVYMSLFGDCASRSGRTARRSRPTTNWPNCGIAGVRIRRGVRRHHLRRVVPREHRRLWRVRRDGQAGDRQRPVGRAHRDGVLAHRAEGSCRPAPSLRIVRGNVGDATSGCRCNRPDRMR